MEKRKINMMFQKGGSGSITTRIAIPKKWVDKIGVTQGEREVIIEFDGERIVVRKMTDMERLIERIDETIEKEQMKSGMSGTELVRVEINLTEEEKELFYGIDKYDSEHYSWEIEENKLLISYMEEI